MTLAFVRHGETDWNRSGRMQGSSDIPLNAIGQHQAVEAAVRLSAGIEGRPWGHIVSSPLVRARQTAQIITNYLGLDLGPEYEGLSERDFGEAEGSTRVQIDNRWPAGIIPGRESVESVASRGRLALENICDIYGRANVLIVCHGYLIQHTLTELAGKDVGVIRNAAISTFTFFEGAWTIHTINDQPF